MSETEISTNIEMITNKKTTVKIYEDEKFGTVCLMNGQIQSATRDEKIYHEFFSGLVKNKSCERVLILGSGEGCLAREMLKRKDVKQVIMVDWDPDVLELFKNKKYSKLWAGETTWKDERLKVEIADAWEWTRKKVTNGFNVILVDLFDPEKSIDSLEKWEKLMLQLRELLRKDGILVAYCGMKGNDIYDETKIFLNSGEFWRGIEIFGTGMRFQHITRNQVFVPSFEGEAVFICAEGFC